MGVVGIVNKIVASFELVRVHWHPLDVEVDFVRKI